MHTKRIIPCLDVKDGRVVKGVNFVDLKDAGDPVEIGAAYDKAGADELVFLDITASSDDRNTAVSYTHLDVYKRQTLIRAQEARNIFTQKMCARIRLWECFRISESWC